MAVLSTNSLNMKPCHYFSSSSATPIIGSMHVMLSWHWQTTNCISVIFLPDPFDLIIFIDRPNRKNRLNGNSKWNWFDRHAGPHSICWAKDSHNLYCQKWWSEFLAWFQFTSSLNELNVLGHDKSCGKNAQCAQNSNKPIYFIVVNVFPQKWPKGKE